MIDLILNSVALDVVGVTGFLVTLYLAWPKPRRRKLWLLAIRDASCWCKAFNRGADCYCVKFTDESETDGA